MIRLCLSAVAVLSLLCCSAVALPQECGVLEPSPVPPVSNSSMVLTQVQVLFRHGDRIMYQDGFCWPNDTGVYECGLSVNSVPGFALWEQESTTNALYRLQYLQGRNYYPGSCGTGMLTNKGYVMEFNVGKMYRSVYVDSGFAPETFDAESIYLRSDSSTRCMQSLQALLTGMYPSTVQSAAWPVYNITSMDTYTDDIAPNSDLCPRFGVYSDEVMYDTAYQHHFVEFTLPLVRQLSTALGYEVTPDDLNQVRDCLIVHKCREQPIPASITDELYDMVMANANYQYSALYNYPTTVLNAQAGIGALLEEMFTAMSDMVSSLSDGSSGSSSSSPINGSQYKVMLWSGHDSSVIPALAAYGAWDNIWVPYASQLVFELYQDANSPSNFYVRAIFDSEEIVLNACCSDVLCPWDDFYAYTQTLFPLPDTCDVDGEETLSDFEKHRAQQARKKLRSNTFLGESGKL